MASGPKEEERLEKKGRCLKIWWAEVTPLRAHSPNLATHEAGPWPDLEKAPRPAEPRWKREGEGAQTNHPRGASGVRPAST